MLRTRLLTAVFTATSLAVLGGCGSDTVSEKPPAPPPEDPVGLAPPEEPAGLSACEGPGKVMAMSQIFLGDTKRDGTPDPTGGWKAFGYDLDGRASTKASVGLCKPRAGGSPAVVYPDGDEGRDNSFGKNILPVILGLASDISAQANEAIANGEFTIMLDMATLGTSSDCNSLTSKLYGGADLGAPPKWDGTDQWPLIPELLSNEMDPTSAKIVFPKSYVVKDTWVSGTKGTVKLSLSISGFTIALDINSAVITVDLNAERNGGTNGTIAGVIETEALITEISKVAAAFDESFCDKDSPTLQSILNQIRQASDIMKNGTQDPAVECDGISIGLGFDAKAVQLGPVAPKGEPPPDPCAMPMP
ncbi:hypothetical protein [Polyangium jinanense]|uniref:Lipoprotein n=1 Tax=Polyangium jinanense TaxID=2829994 RepID=A0A9X3X8L1_9BACT|nr:hypothetical protein [Polyangium jinanense]MDC3957918.1 hypothetical protein [Polyangium jinanense]MDC3961983.1 hypothetical protein [Polyangium jinanense]MDC3983471.1 hypothetical protein [Polyangium jinanense]